MVRFFMFLYYVCCYIVICTVQIKFCIFEYSREATILQVEKKKKKKSDLGKTTLSLKKTVGYLIILTLKE